MQVAEVPGISISLCPEGVIVVVTLEISPRHTVQYVTVSYEPCVTHPGTTGFSITASALVCPDLGVVIVASVPQYAHSYVTNPSDVQVGSCLSTIYTGAYPSTYYSYDNIDFGTVQGFTVGYDLRSTKNVTLRASYTLQFAKGTGSSETSSLAIIQSGQPNLRTLTNLSFDQRHKISANLDYRFGYGTEYNGPKSVRVKDGKTKEINWLENFGVNINFSAGSGLPYSRSSKPYSTIVSAGKAQLSGTINGSNMPWIYQCDIRIDKTFVLNLKKDEETGKPTKRAYLNIYLDVMNLFNFKNVIYVYEYTGNADDDGYLTATEYQQQINSQVDVSSYTNYYRMRVANPYNYTMPTRVRLGVNFSF